MRFVAVGQERHVLCAPRPATVESSVALAAGARDVTAMWERIELPYGRIALRTPYGRFLSCEPGVVSPRLTLAADLGPREAFEEVLWPDGSVSFRTCELTYVAVDTDSPQAHGRAARVVCDSNDTGPATRFTYLDPSPALAEAAADIVAGQPVVPDMPRQFAHTADDLRDTRGDGRG
jgi:hypothetical protein